jgi:hypothetical protein
VRLSTRETSLQPRKYSSPALSSAGPRIVNNFQQLGYTVFYMLFFDKIAF